LKIRFLGATHQVTGSSYLVNVAGLKILVDCGLFQERHYSYRNWEPFQVPPYQIDYLLLTHVHLDHSGLIPKLVREEFGGGILLTAPSKEMLPIVLLDSARIQEEDAAFKKSRHERENRRGPFPEIPLYTVEDARECFQLLKQVPYEEYVSLNDRVRICFHDAGHILGSAMIEMEVQDERGSRSVVFSGDIGQWDKPLLNDPSVFDRADYVIMESTYGNRNHDSAQDVDEKLSRIITGTVGAGGNVVIPTFAIERAQELLYRLNHLARTKRIPYVTTILDSPMAVEITKVFEHCKKYLDDETQKLFEDNQSPFDFPGLRLVESAETSKALNLTKESTVIIAGSGMITGGRIKHHLVNNIARSESTLLFVGYQAAGTLGREILDGASQVRILGQSYPVKMKIERIDAFSAHAGMNDLIRWIDNFKSPPKHIFLTHGEDDSIRHMTEYVRSKGWETSAPSYGEEFEL
jgi:metallo-beta-lactamase family protein